MESKWLKDSLFSGMTANAFKLGTILTQGWFWVRVSGCCVLYRGISIETVEVEIILAVGNYSACQIQPPNYVQHNYCSTYFYVIRRANSCGDLENTLNAAVKVRTDNNGDLCPLRPNNIFAAKAQVVGGARIRVTWYYCPLEQQFTPKCFKIYYDAGTGQIDYETPLSIIDYRGLAFYVWLSNTSDPGQYFFCVKAENSAGRQNLRSAIITAHISNEIPKPIRLLSIKHY